MSFARLSCLRGLPAVSGLEPMLAHGTSALRGSTLKPLMKPYQEFPTKARSDFFQWKPTRDLFKETALEPASTTAIRIASIGRMVVAGGAAVGLGTLYYYGMGMSNEICAMEKAVSWPRYVKDRVQSTYMYFAGSVGLTALSAAAVSRSSALMDLMTRSPWMAFGASCAAITGAIKLVRSISYEDSSKSKHVAWLLHAGVMGAVLAPLALLEGPLMMRTAWYTAGIVGGLSTVAMCAPSERFLYMGGPLAAGLGVVFASSLGSMFLAPTSAIGAGVYSVAVYGGLLLCSGFLLNDTQEVIKRAETRLKKVKYDPINECMGIYTDTFLHNIFVSLVSILADRMYV